ncbi:hypothetical protein [Antarcticirhabdus aurantiaca]|uniref:Uncharacterized protein n=1 Tax=Antarcticirhabdus aurantiaca TaxID=2606717 RepID=A0ACD4NRM3_9HYPH|nr:hypothetical protein OXU80_03550 [Jeongeuplla avenae]
MRSIIGLHLTSIAALALFAAETGSGSGSTSKAAGGKAGADVVVQNGGEAAKTFPRAGGDTPEAGGDNGAAPATEFDPSGAPDQVVADVDPSHPAVDNDPRAHTSADQNRIDMNDPTLPGAEAVERNLAAQTKG